MDNVKDMVHHHVKQFVDVMAECDAKMAERQWISVKDRLPDEDAFVLVAHPCMDVQGLGLGVGINRYSKNYGWELHKTYAFEMGITHWMPLPEPPNGDQNL